MKFAIIADIHANLQALQAVLADMKQQSCTDKRLEGFNPRAAEIVEWTRRQLTPDDRRWLANLPYIQTVAGFIIVHATLDGPERWGYVFDKLAAAASFTYQNAPVCFFGHTHIPIVFRRDTVVRGDSYSRFKVENGKQYFVNPGAVGQPRDNNPKAAYVTYDVDSKIIELRRVAFESPSGGPGSAPLVTNPVPPKPPVGQKGEQSSFEE